MATFRSFPKLVCRVPVNALRKCVPQEVLEKVQDSPQYKRRPDILMTTSDRTTSANANRQDCIKKVLDMLRNTANNKIVEASRKPPRQL